MRSFLVAILALIFTFNANAQTDEKENAWYNWDKSRNFYEIQEDFNNYWNDKNITPETPKEDRGGWKQFKRWEWFWGQRVSPTGEFPPTGFVYNEYLKSKQDKNDKTQSNSWSHVGPTTAPGGYEGLGRLNCIIEDPGYNGTTNRTLWAGAASGGVWKSTDAGASWTTNTDDLSVLGVGDIIIDPNNTNIMYLATGDGDGADTYSIGVLKSTDGGSTWNTTGLTKAVTDYNVCRRIRMSPSDSDELYVTTNHGLYKTTNGGTSWTKTLNDNLYDVDIHPTNDDIIYATGQDEFYRSTDGGDTFTEITSGIPGSTNRLMIAVSENEPDYVYLLGSSTVTGNYNGYRGVYRSTDAGLNFSTRSTTPNLLGWYSDGSDSKGQGSYDLALAVDPTDADLVIVGGVNMHKSTDGGATWTCVGMWTSGSSYNKNGADEVHADHHMLYYPATGRVYTANDGGLDISTNQGDDWTYVGNGIKNTQFYRIGLSQRNSDYLLAGAQDNSSFLKNSSTFSMTLATGDGMENLIDYNNNNNMVVASYYGRLRVSSNGGTNWFSPTMPEEGAWVTPYVQDPNQDNRIVIGFEDVYESTNYGASWNKISNLSNNSDMTVLHVAQANSEYIYAGRASALWRTTDGGTNWSSITLPTVNSLTYIASNYSDPDEIWATFSGYTSGQKVYHSTDGGANWTNISGSLPNVPCNTVIYQEYTDDRVWVGTDIGVWFRDDNLADWVAFNTDLPNVIINELEIHRQSNKLVAGTYGRGVWQADLPSGGGIPDVPVLSSPADNATNIPLSVLLNMTWQEVANADSYELQISESDLFTSTVVNQTGISSEIYNLNTGDLDPYKIYYWRVRSVKGDKKSLWSNERQFITAFDDPLCKLIEEKFEGSQRPANWTEEYVNGVNDWTFGSGGGANGNPASAYEGNNNAVFFNSGYDAITRLVTPLIERGGCSNNLMLEFFRANLQWFNDYDKLTVKYKLDGGATWTTLQTINTPNSAWERQRISLDGINDDFYIAFEAEGDWGYGMCIDKVMIYGEPELEPPVLQLPANASSKVEIDVDLAWQAAQGATSYNLQVSTDPNFNSIDIDVSGINGTTYDLGQETVNYFTPYYWRVQSVNSGGTSNWSGNFQFTTKKFLAKPNLTMPANNGYSRALTPTYNWDDVQYADEYQIQVSVVSGFLFTLEDETVTSSSYISNAPYEDDLVLYWRVKATANSGEESEWSDEYQFTINLLEPPTLTSPADMSVVDTRTPTFSWSSTDFPPNYEIQIDNNSNFSSPEYDETVATNSYTPNPQLNDFTEYWWKVRAKDGSFTGNWSSTRKVTVQSLSAPDLLTPADAASIQAETANLTWTDVTDATTYRIQISQDNTFSSGVLEYTDTDESFDTPIGDLFLVTTYYWRVRSENAQGESSYSSHRSFSLDYVPAPALMSPADGSVDVAVLPSLMWNTASGATEYFVEIATDAGFTSIIKSENVGNTTNYSPSGLLYSETYYWRVKAINGAVESIFSGSRSFTTEESSIPVSWSFTNTGISSTVTVPTSINPQINGRSFQNGDAIGFFYTDGGNMESGGYGEWDGSNLNITVYGDDSNTPDKDGFDDQETYTVKVFDSKKGTEHTALVTYSVGNDYWTDGGASTIGSLSAPDLVTLDIDLGIGWNMISSNVEPDDKSMEAVFNNIVDDILIVKNGQGKIYVPSFTINTIGDWVIEEGYQVYATSNVTLQIEGDEVVPENTPISTSIGWNMLAYLRNSSQDATVALASLTNEDNLLIAKNGQGKIYVPSFAINTIGNMIPTQGYQMYVTAIDELLYPANGGAKITPTVTSLTPENLIPQYSETGVNMSVIVTADVKDGTEIGIYNLEDIIIGSGAFENGAAGITVWGDDEYTEHIDGAKVNEILKAKIYTENKELNEIELMNQDGSKHELTFKNNAIIILKAAVEENVVTSVYIYAKPNPASGLTMIEFNLPESNEIDLKIFNLNGKLIHSISINALQGINQYEFDATDFPSGMYSIAFEFKGKTYTEKLMINR
jgi:photosystem II stability/assembly factor-like uncharacterized protein